MQMRRVRVLRQGPGIPFAPGSLMSVTGGVADAWVRGRRAEFVGDVLPGLIAETATAIPASETRKDSSPIQAILNRARGRKG